MIPYLTSNYYIAESEKLRDRLDFNFNHPLYNLFFEKLLKLGTINLSSILSEDIITGVQPKYDENGEILVIKTIDMKNRYIDYENVMRTSVEFYENNPEGHLNKDDIIIASIGVGSVGKVDIFDIDEKAIFDGVNLNILRINTKKYNPHFLVRFLRSDLGQKQIEKILQGSTGMIYLSPDGIKNILIPDISKIKQENILHNCLKIEKEANVLEKKVKEEYKKINNIIYSELGIVFSQGSEYDFFFRPFDDIDNRIDFLYNNPKYDLLNDYKNKSKYPFIKLKELVNFLIESRNPLKQPDKYFCYVDIGNIDTTFGEINPIEMMGKDATSSRMRRIIHKDDIIISTTRPTRNAISLVPDKLDGQICSTGFAVMKCKEGIDKEYLFYLLRTDLIKIQFEKLCSGSGYPEINQDIDLPQIEIPIPKEIDKQKNIVFKIQPIINIIKEYLVNINKKWEEATSIFDQLLLE